MTPFRFALALMALPLAACGSSSTGPSAATPGDTGDSAPWSGIGPDETVHFTGTEPFWGGEASGAELFYSTLENPAGATIAVERFAGRNGLSLSGEVDGAPFDMALTPGECSDGMSDRSYPFTVTLQVRGEQRNGCAWTDARPFDGPEHP